MAMRTLHPTIDARGLIWRRGEDMDMDNFTTDRGPTEAFLQSPLAYLLENRDILEVHRPLTGANAVLDFPVLQGLKDDGATDYMIRKVPFRVASLQGYESGMLIS